MQYSQTSINLQSFGHLISRIMMSRRVAVFIAAAAVTSCITTYVFLTRLSNDIDTVYWLLNLDLVLLLSMGTVIAYQIAKLGSERKRGIAGAQLHVQLVSVFGALAAVPTIMMAVFSSIFLYYGVHAWFNDRVSTAIHESLEVAQAYLREHQQVIRADVLAMANDLNREASEIAGNAEAFSSYIQTQSQLRNLPEAIVITSSGRTLARSLLSFTLELDRIPHSSFQEAQDGNVVLMTGGDHDRIRALVKLDRFVDSYLYVGRLVDATVLAHIQTTESAVKEYTTLQGKKSQLQLLVTAIFIVLALILLLAAIWFGLVFAERLVKPVSALILAAERVRAGELSVRVPQSTNIDEIALLGRAFNRMTSQLESQRTELVAANRMIDERRRFTEAVLAGASSGIIGLDAAGVITLANARAEELLVGEKETNCVGHRLVDIIPATQEMIEKTREFPDKPASLQLEYAVADAPRRILFLRVTAEDGGSGAVVTIDDISALASAQRKAAWADVARRIAHEIKNPLTPIQLSAERLKRKYLPQITDDPETFERCTDIIIRQVTGIGHMVNEFSAYARMPLPIKQQENVVDLCQDALVLQSHAHPNIGFSFQPAAGMIGANCDRAQMTQVITNLLQNAIDSIHERQQAQPGEGRVRLTLEERGGNISIAVEDNGTGLPAEKLSEQLLEPYVTTKKKGSGLGLAIVKKIMEDHDGSVVLENSVAEDTLSGAKATIVFPQEPRT